MIQLPMLLPTFYVGMMSLAETLQDQIGTRRYQAGTIVDAQNRWSTLSVGQGSVVKRVGNNVNIFF
jgi:hypothetical protein